ncbi:multidrug ABC transporter ATP-binding protein [Spirochaetia bacterium]|nr:multidrug ABC transporter ATP-binding protein [Spirochaetia bacterium]
MNIDKSPLRIFAAYYRPHVKLFAADMAAASLIAAVDLAFPMMTKYTIEQFLPQSLFELFFIMIALMTGLYLARMAFTYFITYWGHTVGVCLEADMRRDLFSHIQELPFSFYDSHRTGQIMSRVTTDLFDITELAHHGPEDLFISVITLAGAVILVATIRWEMAVVLLVFVPFMLFHILRSRSNMLKSARGVKERTADINAALESSISGVRVAKAFTNEPFETDKFRCGNENYKIARKLYYRSMAMFQSRLDLLLHLLNVLVIAAGGFLIMRGRMTLPELITCNLFVSAFLQPIRRLQSFVELYTTGMAGFSRFVELMRLKSDITEKEGAGKLEKVRGDIVFKGVSFAYNNNVTVLSSIDLSIPAGRTIALVGPSGGGKTTLCHLLPRFYEIRSGAITIDAVDIRDVTLESLRRNIGIVAQDVFLFAGTVRDNIKYGRIDAADEQMIEAAKRADIHDDIMKLPDGYDSLVGERGVKLSGGQKQRVSIARIFLKDPPILILDEATSSLDTATELRIQRALEELSRGRTTLVIAHRLSTIRGADAIVVLTDDGIVQQGTHDELLAAGGLYADLYAAQFAGV